jgi:hypothetical protein
MLLWSIAYKAKYFILFIHLYLLRLFQFHTDKIHNVFSLEVSLHYPEIIAVSSKAIIILHISVKYQD